MVRIASPLLRDVKPTGVVSLLKEGAFFQYKKSVEIEAQALERNAAIRREQFQLHNITLLLSSQNDQPGWHAWKTIQIIVTSIEIPICDVDHYLKQRLEKPAFAEGYRNRDVRNSPDRLSTSYTGYKVENVSERYPLISLTGFFSPRAAKPDSSRKGNARWPVEANQCGSLVETLEVATSQQAPHGRVL